MTQFRPLPKNTESHSPQYGTFASGERGSIFEGEGIMKYFYVVTESHTLFSSRKEAFTVECESFASMYASFIRKRKGVVFAIEITANDALRMRNLPMLES